MEENEYEEQNEVIAVNENKDTVWIKKIVCFMIAQTISLFGSSLVQYSMIWYITLSTKSGYMMTISTICAFAPQIVISLFAGVWADRYNRKFLIMISDGLIALSTLFVAISFLLGFGDLWQIFLVSAIRSIGSGIQTPAVSAIIPQIVPQDKLMKVSGINTTIQSLTMIISPAISGALLSLYTLDKVFFIDVITAIIGISITFFIKISLHAGAHENRNVGYFDDLLKGLKYVKENKFIFNLLVFYGIFMFFLVPVAFLTPLMIARSFGEELWKLTANEIAFSSGTIVGGIIISIIGNIKNRIKVIGISTVIFGIYTVILGIVPSFILFLVIMVASGIVIPFFSTPVTVMLQEKVETSMQGRVFSIIGIIASVSMPIGMIIFGPIGDVIKIEYLLVMTGIVITIIGLIIPKIKSLKEGNA